MIEFYQQNSLKECVKDVDSTLRTPYKQAEQGDDHKPRHAPKGLCFCSRKQKNPKKIIKLIRREKLTTHWENSAEGHWAKKRNERTYLESWIIFHKSNLSRNYFLILLTTLMLQAFGQDKSLNLFDRSKKWISFEPWLYSHEIIRGKVVEHTGWAKVDGLYEPF